MAEFVDQDRNGEPDPEFPSEERPIKRDKRKQAEQELELEDRRQQPFELRQKNRDRPERTQLLCPLILRRSWSFRGAQASHFVAYPGSLLRIRRQHIQRPGPEIAGSGQFPPRLE